MGLATVHVLNRKQVSSDVRMPKKGSVALFDLTTQEVRLISQEQMGRKLGDLSQILRTHLEKLEKIGQYELEALTISIGLKGGIIVFTAEGGISLTYKRKVS